MTKHAKSAVTSLAKVVVAASGMLGLGAVYGIAGTPDNAGVPMRIEIAQAAGAAAGQQLNVGHMAAFVYKRTRDATPDIKFQDATGKERSLADWRGKVVLLNLWATWCIPCRKEMPALDRLQAEMGSDVFEVVAVAADRKGIEGASKFLADIKVEKLGVFADPTARVTSTLRALGLPATLLIGPNGQEIGRLVGPAEWDSAEAKALIKSVLPK